MAQLGLEFGRRNDEIVNAALMDTALHVQLTSTSFDFSGRINKPRRKGQFQYRFGRKVLPVDRTF